MFSLKRTLRIVASIYKCSKRKSMKADGLSSGKRLTITINSSLSEEKQASTLFHEITHMIFEEHNIQLTDQQEEAVILAFESGWCAFAKDEQEQFINIVKAMGHVDTTSSQR